MGDIIIKKEDGKEVAYEKGLFGDRRIGELHETSWGTAKETRNAFGDNVRVERNTGIFSNPNERHGSVNGEQGVFKQDTFLGINTDQNPTFYPDAKGRPSGNSPRSSGSVDYSYSGSSYSSDYSGSSSTSSSRSSGVGCGTLLLFGAAIIVLADYGLYLERREKAQQQSAPVVYYQPAPQTPPAPVYTQPTEQTSSTGLTERVMGDTLMEYPKNIEAKEPRTAGISGMIFPSKRLNNLGGTNVVYEVKVSYMNGHEYVIPKEKYPEFYDKLSFGDGQLVYEEIWAHSYVLGDIIKSCVEGDLESITREFVNLHK